MTILATASRLFAPNAQSRIARALLLALLLGVAFQRAATAAAAGEDRGDPEKPVCLFLTGLGVKSSRVEFRGSYEAYWGELHDAVSEYCTPRFFKTDTSFRGWDDKALQAEYCAAIHATQARIIFTHSMGGLVVAAGIHNKLLGCDRIAKTTEVVTGKNVVWINVQSPFRGSEIADQCSQFCRTADEWEKSKSPFMMRVNTFVNGTVSRPVTLLDALDRVLLAIQISLPRATPAVQSMRAHLIAARAHAHAGANQLTTATEDAIRPLAMLLITVLKGQCGCNGSRAEPAVETVAHTYRASGDLQISCKPEGSWRPSGSCVEIVALAKKYVRGQMCGISPVSVMTWEPLDYDYSLVYHVYANVLENLKIGKNPFNVPPNHPVLMPFASGLANWFVGWGVDASTRIYPGQTTGTDGFVAFSSCALKENKFYRYEPEAHWYAMLGNHGDGIGRVGDARNPNMKHRFDLKHVLKTIAEGYRTAASALEAAGDSVHSAFTNVAEYYGWKEREFSSFRPEDVSDTIVLPVEFYKHKVRFWLHEAHSKTPK